MDYALKPADESGKKGQALLSAASMLEPLLTDEKGRIALAVVCVAASSIANLLSPVLIARVVDTAMTKGDYPLLLRYGGFLAVVYVLGLVSSYTQTISMGTTGRNVLYKLRNALFVRLSELPIAFFSQNRAGDLISRVNSDTDKINQFFTQALMQFFGAFFVILGAGILLLTLNWKMGIVALIPGLGIVIVTQVIGPWVKATSRRSLESLGALSGDVQECLTNFKVIVAFNRVDYFRDKFAQANERNYKASVTAGIASGAFTPLYTLAGAIGQILVLAFGVLMIGKGSLTVGLLIGYLLYVTAFYNPLRQLATVWSSLQQAMAALDRVSEVLHLESDMARLPAEHATHGPATSGPLLEFDHVDFAYVSGKPVLEGVSFALERGKTYALVGPTGGGKTTTAMLMARLYDPTRGTVRLDGRDIRTLTEDERAKKIGFILQEPFLFDGTVRDNIAYGHDELFDLSNEALTERLATQSLDGFLDRFDQGLATPTKAVGDGLSLGQKQLIAFMRAVIREPEILILDEATANIDTVTEQLLEEVLARLPKATTKVIIAHRLNTIQNADDIFFVGGGGLTEAGSMDDALKMLLSAKRVS